MGLTSPLRAYKGIDAAILYRDDRFGKPMCEDLRFAMFVKKI